MKSDGPMSVHGSITFMHMLSIIFWEKCMVTRRNMFNCGKLIRWVFF